MPRVSIPTDIGETVGRIASRFRRGRDVRDVAADWWDRWAGTEEKRRRLGRRGLFFGVPGLVAIGLALWLILGPMSKPNYESDGIDRVFTFTLLTDQFNRLPIEERLRLTGIIVDRLKKMTAQESVYLAAFAAGIAGESRKQMEENLSRLAIDLWDKYADEYTGVPEGDRGPWLDSTFIEFTRTMESLAGESTGLSDAEILSRGRRDARRDVERAREGRAVPGRLAGRAFSILHNNVGSHANLDQRQRGQQLGRDMMRRMRDPGGG